MKNRIMFILVLVLLFSFYTKNVSAGDLCSSSGYTILTVNGIFTDKNEALSNRNKLASKFDTTHNNQPLTVDFLYNPTHLAGVGDLIDAVKQGLFDQKSDYDLVEMLNDASRKVTTQKLLLVAHSQGNFYANNFYDKVADQEGGVPRQSIGMYSVASPADRIAGGGRYMTSSTDKVIASLVSRYIKILPPNIRIPLSGSKDGDGHSFSDVYLKYQGDKIVSDIKSSLGRLVDNDEQNSGDPCISPLKLSLLHKVQGLALAAVDKTANFTKSVAVNTATGSYKIASAIGGGVYKGVNLVANSISSLTKNISEMASNSAAGIIFSNGGVFSNTNTPNPTNSNPSQKGPIVVPQFLNKIKTLAKSFVDPSSASAENSVDSSLPVPASVPEDTNINNSESVENNTGTGGTSIIRSGGSGSATPPPAVTEPEITEPEDVVEPEIIPPVVTEPDIAEPDIVEPEIIPPVITPPLVPDVTSPVITIVGDNPIEITKDTVYTDAGATALDDVDGDITANIITVNPVDTTTLGIYTITYDVSDSQNNVATQVTRIVNVVAPLPPPPPLLNTLTINENTTLTAGEYNYDNLIITNNAVLTLEGNPASSDIFKGVKINAVNITVDAGSSISADSKGYGANQGPGAMENLSATSNPGASYGGASLGSLETSRYGSATRPTDLGSGGAYMGVGRGGGGAMQIVVSDTFTNNGIVSANGDTSSSGGSIYVTAKNIGGSGIFKANGGGLYGSGYFKSPGGGGRIAIYYQNSSFSGTAEAKGGCGQYDGMTMSCSENGTVGFFNESTNDLYVNNYWRFQKNDNPFNLNNIFITNSKVAIDDGVEINASGIFLDKISTLTLSGGETINAGTLSILGNSIITVIPEKILSLKVLNLNIENGSMISADDKGYVGGPGTPDTFYESGASYGGKGGGATAKVVYGSEIAPIDFGSGAESRRGGGAIRLVVDNNFKNDGAVSASAIQQRVSGGSIYVTTDKISGNGIFKANGGNSSWPYGAIGGGGGRIAIHYKTSDFAGTATALAGKYCYSGCNPAGEAGTIKMVDDSIPVPLPPVPIVLSSEKMITAFNFSNLTPNVAGVIDETNHTISSTVLFGTDVKVLVPTITISEKASINPNTDIAQDFTSPFTYTVTAEDGSTQNYIVTVLITPAPEPEPIPEPEPEPEPAPDTTLPSIASYTFNGVAGSITTDPLVNPISIVLTANENVNWTSIKIEKEDNASLYKYFYPGDDCDGSSTCTQGWNGILSSGGLLQNGIYKIKVHMKDLAGNDFTGYLSPHVITVNTPL